MTSTCYQSKEVQISLKWNNQILRACGSVSEQPVLVFERGFTDNHVIVLYTFASSVLLKGSCFPLNPTWPPLTSSIPALSTSPTSKVCPGILSLRGISATTVSSEGFLLNLENMLEKRRRTIPVLPSRSAMYVSSRVLSLLLDSMFSFEIV